MGFLILSVLVLSHLVAGSSSWPSVSTMLSNYPLDRNHAFIDRAGLPTWLYNKNTCAMRVTNALYESGYTMDIKKGEFNWAQVRATRNTNKPKYIIRVDTMKLYLEDRKGSADIVSINKSAFAGKKGIIVFQDCPNFRTATGHVDLYDGSKCKGQCYFSPACRDIRLFEFN